MSDSQEIEAPPTLHPLARFQAMHYEYESWKAFLRELSRATKLPAAHPSLDVVLRAAARWGEENATSRYYFHEPEMVNAALMDKRQAYPIPNLDDESEDLAEGDE